MTISTNISFHNVSRIEIGKESRHTIQNRTWRIRIIRLFDKDDEQCTSFQVHSPEDRALIVDMEE